LSSATLVAGRPLGYNEPMSDDAKPGGMVGPATGSTLTGALWMLLAAFCFSLMLGIVRHLSTELHPFEIAFFRNFFGLIFMVPWFLHTRLGGLRTNRIGLHFLRAVLGLLGMLCWFWAISNMPLASAVALNFTLPLFITVLAVVVLHETVRARRWTATAVGFLGTLVILRPGAAVISQPALLVLLASVFMASAAITIKMLSRTENPNAIVAYMVTFLTPLSLVPALFVWTTPGWSALLWLVALGGLATLAHQSLTRAFHAADASALMPFDYARLPFAAAIGYVAFGQSVDVWTWVGGAIIAGAGVYIAHREAVLGRARTAPLGAGDRAGGV
jgi:drug/metabolite transporter (DMT)-like permease